MSPQETPGYYAVIPADVRYDDALEPNAKLLYGEISALIGPEGFCYASNAYFMRLFQFSDRTVSRLIASLESSGYIIRENERDTTGQVVRRKIYLRVSMPQIQPPDNIVTTPRQYCQEGGDKNGRYTNLSNTDKEKKKKEKPSENRQPLTDEQLRETVIDAINRLATPIWSSDDKNAVFSLVMTMYDPKREVRKSRPVRSRNSVNAMFRKFSTFANGDPKSVILMLTNAIEAGWQGVQPLSPVRRPAPTPPREEREYECV